MLNLWAILQMDYNKFSYQVIRMVSAKHNQQTIPLVTVLFSGRPMIVGTPSKALANSQAFIAAWLLGTTGGQACCQYDQWNLPLLWW